MRFTRCLLLGLTLLATSATAARADIHVVASIKPVHSLVAATMEGVGKPGLIVEGAGSPHTYAMKPSQAAMLEKANLVFWIGHELEAFLEKPLETIASRAKVVALIDTDDLIKLDLREGGAFETHEHHEGESHDGDAGHGGLEDKHHHHAKANGDHREFDAHVWLDPANAKVLVHAISKALAEVDPANATKYDANAIAVIGRLDALRAEIAAKLEPVKRRGFVVFHDAYQNFEKRFGLQAIGSITLSPEVMPGAKRIRELRAKVRESGAACVFSEPQFPPKLVATLIEGTSAKSSVLDPLGASLHDGSELYFDLIRNMAASFKVCLSESS